MGLTTKGDFTRPRYICDKCNLVVYVEGRIKTPEGAKRRFKRIHKDCNGQPFYQAGVLLRGRMMGQTEKGCSNGN